MALTARQWTGVALAGAFGLFLVLREPAPEPSGPTMPRWEEITDLHPSEAWTLAGTVGDFGYACPGVAQAWRWRGDVVANCGGPEQLYLLTRNQRGLWYARPFEARCLNEAC